MTHPARESQGGFTLLEVMGAIFIAALVLSGVVATMRTIDRGWRATVEASARHETLTTALRVVAEDIARIERIATADGQDYEFEGSPSEMVYVLNERPEGAVDGLYLVRLLVRDGAEAELERARARYRRDDKAVEWGAETVLARGGFAMEFSYRAPSAGLRDWRTRWIGEGRLPEQVRIEIRDRKTGEPVLPAMIQTLKITADAACVDLKSEACTLRRQGRLQGGDG